MAVFFYLLIPQLKAQMRKSLLEKQTHLCFTASALAAHLPRSHPNHQPFHFMPPFSAYHSQNSEKLIVAVLPETCEEVSYRGGEADMRPRQVLMFWER